jgi:hypothetical protein
MDARLAGLPQAAMAMDLPNAWRVLGVEMRLAAAARRARASR